MSLTGTFLMFGRFMTESVNAAVFGACFLQAGPKVSVIPCMVEA